MNEIAMDIRYGWILYGLLVVCRVFVAPFLPGYVHPDEFFQGGQELWFGCPPFTPWEFETQHALRSVIPPTIMTWLPLRFYAWMLGEKTMSTLSGGEILVVPRIFCGILSVLTVDASVWHMMPSSRKNVPTVVLIMASAWPSWVMLNRPFSNALETMLLVLLLLVTSQPHRYINNLAAGMICALGLFTRFTFTFVSFPIMLRYIADMTTFCMNKALLGLILVGIGFLGTATGVIYADVVYYKGADKWTSYITPWNALLYNSKVENLQDHGLHPRWTHALVNMFLLYGPLAAIFYVFLGKRIASLFIKEKRVDMGVAVAQARIRSTSFWTVLSGLGFLSLAPHQEPRFLLPLLVPLAILSKPQLSSSSSWVLSIWILFNIILLFLYGILHQGGVLPSLLATAAHDKPAGAPRAVFYYHTYMPPTFASRKRNKALTECPASAEIADPMLQVQGIAYCSMATPSCGTSPIIDLKGSSVDFLVSALSEQLACDSSDHGAKDNNVHVSLVAPPLTKGRVVLGHDCFLDESYSCRHVRSYRPHLTTEDFPPFEASLANTLWSMELTVYDISCN
jgi:GPI mannosyltransferase 4